MEKERTGRCESQKLGTKHEEQGTGCDLRESPPAVQMWAGGRWV